MDGLCSHSQGRQNEDHVDRQGKSGETSPNWEATKKNLDLKIFESMKCVDCSKIPSPYYRFLCPNGHMYCAVCGGKHCNQLDAACEAVVEKDEKTKDVEMKGIQNGFSSRRGAGETCQAKIKRYPTDPIFSALYLRALWKCPNLVRGGAECQEETEGSTLFDHLSAEVCKPSNNNMGW